MPSRWQCLLIVASWVAATGWLYYREMEPNLRTHEPPPYVIDLTAETQIVHPSVVWKVFQNDQTQESYRAKTRMEHQVDDDSFVLYAEVLPNRMLSKPVQASLLVQRLESSYRVSREGRLLAMNVEGKLSSRPVPWLPELGIEPEFQLKGTVAHQVLIVQVLLPQLDGVMREAKSNFQIPISNNGALFLPLHPVHKIHGVRPGRTWRVPRLDPLDDAANTLYRKLAFSSTQSTGRFLSARVRDQKVPFPYDMGDGEDHVCWVIDYQGDEGESESATTWVEVDTDLVLCQEARRETGSLRLVRDSALSKVYIPGQ
jgi:hypothetical protein